MTFKKLCEILEKNNIPKDVHLMSDSGWECYETEMDGIYYNKKENIIVFTQQADEYERYHKLKNWKELK